MHDEAEKPCLGEPLVSCSPSQNRAPTHGGFVLGELSAGWGDTVTRDFCGTALAGGRGHSPCHLCCFDRFHVWASVSDHCRLLEGRTRALYFSDALHPVSPQYLTGQVSPPPCGVKLGPSRAWNVPPSGPSCHRDPLRTP